MNNAAFSAAISGAVAIITAALTAGSTYLLTKRREREADWRKMKLDLYKDYVVALSGIVEGRATPEGHIRYVDAVNSLTLVGSSEVMAALYDFLDYNSYRNNNKSLDRHDRLLGILLREMRQDIYPAGQHGNSHVPFRLMTVPPDIKSSQQRSRQD